MAKKQIDWMKVQKLMMKLVTEVMNGQAEYVKAEAILELPKTMIEILEYIARTTKQPVDLLLTELASAGILSQLQENIELSLQETELDKELGLPDKMPAPKTKTPASDRKG
jgi:uncharacterized protein YjcR